MMTKITNIAGAPGSEGAAAASVAGFVGEHAKPNEFILGPPGFMQCFHYAETYIEPNHAYHWAIVHLERMEEIEPSVLRRLPVSGVPVFANQYFVVFAQPSIADRLAIDASALRPFFENLQTAHQPKTRSWTAYCDAAPQSPNVEIVIGHYREDLAWTQALPYPTIIISKTRRDLQGFVSPNYGKEASMYLTYIVARYANLPDVTGFFHGHADSPHQQLNSAAIIKSTRLDKIRYLNVNRDDWVNVVRAAETWPDNRYGHRLIASLWPTLFAPYLGERPAELRSYASSQFFVHKDLVRSLPLAAYRHWLDWIMTTEIPDYWSSRVVEYLWHYILTRRAIEPVRKLADFLQPAEN